MKDEECLQEAGSELGGEGWTHECGPVCHGFGLSFTTVSLLIFYHIYTQNT